MNEKYLIRVCFFFVYKVAPIQEVSPSIIDKSIVSETKAEDSGSAIIAAMCQQLSQGLSLLSAKNDDDVDDDDQTTWPLTSQIGLSDNGKSHFSPPATLQSSIAQNINKSNGTGLNHLVKDANSLFSFSNIGLFVFEFLDHFNLIIHCN